MSELKETKKIYVFDRKSEKLPLNQMKLKVWIEGDLENICCTPT